MRKLKDELLQYIIGLCQAASAALLASAIIISETTLASLIGCGLCAVFGASLIVLKNKEELK